MDMQNNRCAFYLQCALILLLPAVQDVNLRIAHNIVHLRDIEGIVETEM